MPDTDRMDRNLALEVVRVTEAAALANQLGLIYPSRTDNTRSDGNYPVC